MPCANKTLQFIRELVKRRSENFHSPDNDIIAPTFHVSASMHANSLLETPSHAIANNCITDFF